MHLVPADSTAAQRVIPRAKSKSNQHARCSSAHTLPDRVALDYHVSGLPSSFSPLNRGDYRLGCTAPPLFMPISHLYKNPDHNNPKNHSPRTTARPSHVVQQRFHSLRSQPTTAVSMFTSYIDFVHTAPPNAWLERATLSWRYRYCRGKLQTNPSRPRYPWWYSTVSTDGVCTGTRKRSILTPKNKRSKQRQTRPT